MRDPMVISDIMGYLYTRMATKILDIMDYSYTRMMTKVILCASIKAFRR